ncbi:hypothetical protein CEXT_583361 [Caerostris extrusa]|uniref:Uncharacterized protein n=1 Tax=Caerostris extrusa TaxID=172846 RepID=A0AAV4UZE1_CAEEX|nr:hypothetical protein CEXT_583361 [Caerostris extrusa]
MPRMRGEAVPSADDPVVRVMRLRCALIELIHTWRVRNRAEGLIYARGPRLFGPNYVAQGTVQSSAPDRWLPAQLLMTSRHLFFIASSVRMLQKET